MTTPAAPIAEKWCHGVAELMLQRLLDPAGDREDDRLAARCRLGKMLIECAFDTRRAMAVDIREAEHVRRKRGLRVEPVGFALNGQPGFAKRVHRFDQGRRCAAAQVEEGLPRAKHARNTRSALCSGIS